MRFGLLQAAHCTRGVDLVSRYHEIIDEAVAAEAAGFDFYAVPEQHFDPGLGVTNISVSEAVLAAVAARTHRIRLTWLSAVLPIHHPLRVAEVAATLDILSNGRFELCTARSNDLPTLRAFGCDPSETRDRWRESLGIIAQALEHHSVEHTGRFWDIPRVTLNPKPVQSPHPPLFYASTSVDGHREAGSIGLGVVSGNSLTGGWPYVEECARTYKAAVHTAEPIGAYVNDALYSFVFVANCAETGEQAQHEAAEAVQSIISMVTSMFTQLASKSADYAYMQNVTAIHDRRHDLQFLNDRAPYISLGTPDFFVERFKRLESMGYDGVVLRVDGMPHEACLRSIEMLGAHVLPTFQRRHEEAPATAAPR